MINSVFCQWREKILSVLRYFLSMPEHQVKEPQAAYLYIMLESDEIDGALAHREIFANCLEVIEEDERCKKLSYEFMESGVLLIKLDNGHESLPILFSIFEHLNDGDCGDTRKRYRVAAEIIRSTQSHEASLKQLRIVFNQFKVIDNSSSVYVSGSFFEWQGSDVHIDLSSNYIEIEGKKYYAIKDDNWTKTGRARIVAKLHFRRVFWMMVIGIIMFQFNPFDYDEVTNGVSRNVILNSLSANYPDVSDSENGDVVVFLFDDGSLGDAGWPPRYSTYTDVLARILQYAPSALMFDIALIDVREDRTIDSLKDILIAYHDNGIPVFFPVPDTSTRALSPVRSDLQPLIDNNVLIPVSVVLGEKEAGIHGYPLAPDQNGNLPVAVKMYEVLRMGSKNKLLDIVDDSTDMEIFWKNPFDTVECKVVRTYECDQLTKDYVSRFFRLFGEGFLGNVFDINESRSYQDFLPFDTKRRDDLDEENREYLEDLITSSVIFVGADIALINDSADTIVYGNLPRVYLHAMAYHNLVAFDDDIFKRYNPWRISDFLHVIISMTLTLFVFFIARMITSLLLSVDGFIRKQSGYHLFAGALVLALVPLLLALYEFHIMRVSPMNWLGIMGIFAVFPLLENIASDMFSRKIREKVL